VEQEIELKMEEKRQAKQIQNSIYSQIGEQIKSSLFIKQKEIKQDLRQSKT